MSSSSMSSQNDYIRDMEDINIEDVEHEVNNEETTNTCQHNEVEFVENIKYKKATVKLSKRRRVYTLKGEDPEYCLWPVTHGDIRELKTSGTHRGLPLGMLQPEPHHLGTRSGVRAEAEPLVVD